MITDAFLLLLVLLGHGFLWIGLVNRLHAVNIPRPLIKRITLVFFVLAAAIPVALLAWFFQGRPLIGGGLQDGSGDGGWRQRLITGYAIACGLIGAITLVRLAVMRWLQRTPSVVRYDGRRMTQLEVEPSGGDRDESNHHRVTRWPFNEILRLQITERALELPRLPSALDGLSIVQLSDLHFTGRIGKTYFREVVRVSNELEPDLIAITGDVLDSPDCFDWLGDTLGQLRARHGVYFILGNHDLRVDSSRLRQTLAQMGLVDLGGQWRRIEINGQHVSLCGNERPWFKHAGDRKRTPGKDGLCIALAHSPDQLGWARRREIDLMLSGHTHGGQIHLPALGALFSPSARGVRYLAGVYDVPPTVLHISRGISSDIPVRWRCPPEVVRLELRSRQ